MGIRTGTLNPGLRRGRVEPREWLAVATPSVVVLCVALPVR